MEELVFRTAQEHDVAAIETLERQCFAVPWSYESLYHDVMKNRLASYIVAEADGVLCGYVGIWKIVDEHFFFLDQPQKVFLLLGNCI